MLIEVTGGPRPLWVGDDDCRLPNGDLAQIRKFNLSPPVPDWYAAPANSRIRATSNDLGLFENRSGHATVLETLAFYSDLVAEAGLARIAEPQVGRAGPGFEAENADHRLGIDLYQHKDLVFWTIYLGSMKPKPGMAFAGYLEWVDGNDERIVLRHPLTAEECWAPTFALRESKPPEVKPEPARTEPILWSSLPAWVQFGLSRETQGESHRWRDHEGVERWNATLETPVMGDSRSAFADGLNSLDDLGFDGSGTLRPDHSYYVSLLQWGHSLNLHVQSKEGDQAIATVLNTLGRLSLSIRYSPPR